MKFPNRIGTLIAGLSVMSLFNLALLAAESDLTAPKQDLAKEFTSPPASARPWVLYFPINGNLTKEGITADLEAMARVGIGGMVVMEVTFAPKGPAAFAGPLWMELFTHLCTEAQRLGLQINMNNDAGWCGSGGPWITPEMSMQKVVWSETRIDGGKPFDGALPQPQAVAKYYRDIAVLAFPTPALDAVNMADAAPQWSSSGTTPKPGQFTLAKHEGEVVSYVQLEFAQPFPATVLTAKLSGPTGKGKSLKGELQVSEDGQQFKTLQKFTVLPPTMTLEFPFQQSRFYRLVFNKIEDAQQTQIEVGNIELSPRYRLENFPSKTSFQDSRFLQNIPPPSPANWPAAPAEAVVARDRIVDLSGKMDATGKLTYAFPPGTWTVLRFGHTSTGQKNGPPPDAGSGLECDKLSKEAANVAFNGLMGRLIAQNQALTGPGKTLVSTHIDSWEIGYQNWTPLMREEFKQRRGYDLLTLLPTFTGRVVDNVEATERFLWDLRQTVSDLLVENYAGEFRRLAHQNGLRISMEAYGGPFDELAHGGQADEPMGEFWAWDRLGSAESMTAMASSAHTYGRRILAVEAFTSGPGEKWLGHPGFIKDLGDWAFCEGVNRFVIHRYAAQPWTNPTRVPGMSMGLWGLHYERTQTWWEQSKPWHDYLARCQAVLQQGLFVADVAYLAPEGAPLRFTPPKGAEIAPHVRGGYNFDGCSPDVVLNRMSVQNGRIVLPDGMSYAVLVLPEVETMTPKLLRKISQLADQGAMVIASGKPPQKSPSLADAGPGDAEVKKLADALWSSGKIIIGKTAAEVLGARGVKPDFSATQTLRYTHRALAEAEVYFVANPESKQVDAVADFRMTGKQPEFWWPDTGRTERVNEFEIKDGVTRIPLRLDPRGSVFVIFREATKVTQGTGKNWVDTVPVQDIAGPWEIAFDPKWGGPAKVIFNKLEDWSKRPEDGIKYYSGTANYQTTFHFKPTAAPTKTWLDLGKVAVMAQVTLNGKDLGIFWKPPYRVDVTEALRTGENTLEIKVVNLLINRQIGDEQLPDDRDPSGATLKAWPQWLQEGKPSPTGRFTFSTFRLWKKTDALVESGLLGPVTLQSPILVQ